jgi:hypothetical protein
MAKKKQYNQDYFKIQGTPLDAIAERAAQQERKILEEQARLAEKHPQRTHPLNQHTSEDPKNPRQ